MTILGKIVPFILIFVIPNLQSNKSNDFTIEELEYYIKEKKLEINPRYKLQYHVTPPIGWMNDPNGFSYYKGEYHLFYQFYPYEAKWGPMHWGHFSSPDLVNWKQLPTALVPEKEMCFSGNAIVDGDTMILMYTGHMNLDDEPFLNETQYLAFSDDGISFEKYEGNPVLSFTPDGVADFRDPKVWMHGDFWYVVLGSKTLDGRGRVLLFRSIDLKTWNFLTVLAESDGNFGYVWECPDFFELDGKFILIVSPQGVNTRGEKYKSSYQSGYIVGDFNYDNFEFKPEVGFREIDYGHDFYAAQTVVKDGQRYLIAWFAKWEETYKEDSDGWINAMTIVREVKLNDDNRLLFSPIDAVTALRSSTIIIGEIETEQTLDLGKSAEIIISCNVEEKMELIFEGINGGDQARLRWDPESKKVAVDRNGNIQHVEWKPVKSHSWRIFLDTSSLELFCGEGEIVFSSRVYPEGGWRITNLSNQILTIEAYHLKKSVPE